MNDTHTQYYELEGNEDGYDKVIEKLINTLLPAMHIVTKALEEEETIND